MMNTKLNTNTNKFKKLLALALVGLNYGNADLPEILNKKISFKDLTQAFKVTEADIKAFYNDFDKTSKTLEDDVKKTKTIHEERKKASTSTAADADLKAAENNLKQAEEAFTKHKMIKENLDQAKELSGTNLILCPWKWLTKDGIGQVELADGQYEFLLSKDAKGMLSALGGTIVYTAIIGGLIYVVVQYTGSEEDQSTNTKENN